MQEMWPETTSVYFPERDGLSPLQFIQHKISCTFVVSDNVEYLMQLALVANGDGESMRRLQGVHREHLQEGGN
jgi:hypothetical protein